MRPFRPIIVLLGVALLAGCAQRNNAVVGNGPFQKRKYQPGWHVDLFSRATEKTAAHNEQRRNVREFQQQEEASPTTAQTETANVQARDMEVFTPSASIGTSDAGSSAKRPMAIPRAIDESAADVPEQENLMPRKRLQTLAIPSAVFVGAGITMAFVTNSGLLVAAALLIGLVLAAVSLRRIRTQERSGKGFALAALVLGTLAAVLTTMVIIRTGF